MTSTALQIHTPTPRDVAPLGGAGVSMGDLFKLADALVPTGFLPQHIKTPGQAVAIILAGREMRMEPMRALRSLRMVKGNVTEAADSQLARFKADGGRASFKELTETRAVLWLKHPNGDEHTETFTLDDAKAAGLLGDGGMYRKFPKAMLRSRAITAGLKSVGWDGAVGNYDPSELVEIEDAPSAAPAPAPDGRAASAAPLSKMTIEEARALPFPFQKGKPIHGRPLGECKNDLLASVATWITEKQAEHGDDFYADVQHAIRLVLADRAKEQEVLPLDDDGGLALDDARPATGRPNAIAEGR